MKTPLSFFCFLLLTCFASAREMPSWPYEKLTLEADLIVIATPTNVRDTEEKTTLPNIWLSGGGEKRPIPAIGVETTFDVSSVLKGRNDTKTFVFHHLREAEKLEVLDGPGLVLFDPKEKKSFLLFLKREADGRYTSLSGQTDPDVGVKALENSPPAASQTAIRAPSDRESKLEQQLTKAMTDLNVALDAQATLAKKLEIAKQAAVATKAKLEEAPLKSHLLPADNSPETIAVAAKMGSETAAADIKTGTFRILEYGMPRPITADTKDPQTGFRIQSVAGCKINETLRTEADAYNKVMREWHAKNPTPLKK